MIDVKLVESAPPTPRSTPEASDSSGDEINVCIMCKGSFSWDLFSGHKFKLFPANIWILKFFFLMVFAIKMILENIYGLLNSEPPWI